MYPPQLHLRLDRRSQLPPPLHQQVFVLVVVLHLDRRTIENVLQLIRLIQSFLRLDPLPPLQLSLLDCIELNVASYLHSLPRHIFVGILSFVVAIHVVKVDHPVLHIISQPDELIVG